MTRLNPWHGALATILLAVAMTPQPASTQDEGEVLVPLEVVEALIQPMPYIGRRPSPEVLVGRLPSHFAIEPLPGSRVIGSAVSRNESVSALAVPGTRIDARERWVEHLLATGWVRYRERPERGFAGRPAERLVFCLGDSITVDLGFSEKEPEGSMLHIRQTDRSRSICRSQAEREERARGFTTPIPTLVAPRRSIARGGGSGGGSAGWHSEARLETPLTAAELLDHYAAQLRDNGWEPIQRVADPLVATETYRVVDDHGTEWHGVLVLTREAEEGDQAFASVRMIPLEGRL